MGHTENCNYCFWEELLLPFASRHHHCLVYTNSSPTVGYLQHQVQTCQGLAEEKETDWGIGTIPVTCGPDECFVSALVVELHTGLDMSWQFCLELWLLFNTAACNITSTFQNSFNETHWRIIQQKWELLQSDLGKGLRSLFYTATIQNKLSGDTWDSGTLSLLQGNQGNINGRNQNRRDKACCPEAT